MYTLNVNFLCIYSTRIIICMYIETRAYTEPPPIISTQLVVWMRDKERTGLPISTLYLLIKLYQLFNLSVKMKAE